MAPVFRVDSKEFEKLTGDTAYITTWHPSKEQRKPLYYLEEVNLTTKSKLVRIRKGSKDGEVGRRSSVVSLGYLLVSVFCPR